MDYIEISGKTVDDALTEALVSLKQQAIKWMWKLWKRAVPES